MLDNFCRLAGFHIATLYTFPGIGQRILKSAFRQGNTLKAHLQPGVIHQRKHAGKTVARLADQIAHGAFVFTKTHDAGRAGVNTQLVFRGQDPHIITPAR